MKIYFGRMCNNKIAVQFEPYEKTDFSTFQRTNFLTTGELLDGSTAQDAFVKMDGVSTIVFRGCTFKHQWRDSEPSYTDHGTGIYSENSGFKIDIVCLDNADPCTNPRNSVFENLTRGIYAMNSGKSYGILMWNTLFIDNYEGAYLSGFSGTSNVCIYSSKFKNGVPTLWSYGLYLNECSEYQIENNEFYEEAVIPSTIGLIVNNSGTANNEIYRNTFHNLRIATLSQNANRNYEPPLHLGGLCYKCNKFVKDETLAEPNLYDLAITYDDALSNNSGIAKNQGTYLSGTSFSSAGNMFQPSPVSTHFDIYNEANQVNYYYHSSTTLHYKLRPENNYGPVTTISVAVPFTDNSCPSTLPGGSTGEDVSTLMAAQDQSDSLGETLTTLVDGGSTSLLTFEVATSTTPEAMQIRSELLTESPYLSDTVMKTSVGKEEVLDNAMIRDILVANPHSAKSDEIINKLGERTLPMPDFMMEQILAGEDTVSTKEILEAKKAWWDNKASKSYARLLNRFKGDSVIPTDEDSLNWLFAYRNTLSSWYDKVGWLHAQGEFPEAENVLTSIPGIFNLTPAQLETHYAYLDFYSLSEQIFTDTTGNNELDSAVVSSLQNMAAFNAELPGTYARNMLISHGYLSYQEPIILPDAGLKDTRKEKFKGVKVDNSNSMLSVFPNPANDYFVIKIDLGKAGDQGILTLRDGTGRLIRSHPFYGSQDQLVWSTSDLQSGMYLLSLTISGKQSDCVKITVVK